MNVLLARSLAIQEDPSELINLEMALARILKKVAYNQMPLIKQAINAGFQEMFPYWAHYTPRQRGRSPIGDNIPSGDLGEKVVGMAFVAGFLQLLGASSFLSPIGLPYGGDYRWITAINDTEVAIHLDIKATGPRDNPNELVVPANQVTGFPDIQNSGGAEVFVSVPLMVGAREPLQKVRPALSPLVPFKGRLIPQLTAFIKFVYTQRNGVQALDKLKIALVPNGILLLGPNPYYAKYLKSTARRKTPFNKGKDDAHRKSVVGEGLRFRILLDWLASLDPQQWRVTPIT